MRKRLRKKLHKSEFKQYGFEVCFEIAAEYGGQEYNDLIDAFILQAIEGNKLCFGGGGTEKWEGFVMAVKGSATENHRVLMEEWFKNQPLISKYQVGLLKNAWE